MKKLLMGFGMLVLVLGMAGGANAILIGGADVTLGGVSLPNQGLTSTYASTAGFTVVDFNTPATSWTVAPEDNAHIVTGTSPGQYATPANNTSPYFSVPKNVTPGSYNTTVSSSNYLGLYWGSIDWLDGGNPAPAYNVISLYSGVSLIATITGQDLFSNFIMVTPPSGDQFIAATNQYVNIVTNTAFDKIVISANQYAFELDNVVTGTVPEPATMLTLGLALLGLAGLKKKFEL